MKRILAMALSIALVATLAISGTVAYLTDKDEAVNTFSFGKVSIEQYEQERINKRIANSGLQSYTQNQVLYPKVDAPGNQKLEQNVDGWTIQIRDESVVRNYVDKIVNIKNTSDKSEAYVRTIIAIPYYNLAGTNANNAGQNWLHWNGISDTDHTPGNGWHWGAYSYTTKYSSLDTSAIKDWPANSGDWHTCITNINGRAYELYVATNENPLAAGAYTAPSLVGFYLDSRVDFDPDTNTYYYVADDGTITNLGTIEEMQILVASQATQVNGFDNAYQALDMSFGEISPTNHPFTTAATTPITPVAPDDSGNSDGDGDGDDDTTTNPNEVVLKTEANLFWFADQVNNKSNTFQGKTIKLDADITLTQNWTPVGQTGTADFKGTFDGQNHTITGLTVSSNDSSPYAAVGFFGFLDTGASIKDVKFVNANVAGNHYAGVAAGFVQNGNVTNVHVTGSNVTSTHLDKDQCGDKAGAIVGYFQMDNGGSNTFSDCSATNCTVSAARDAGQLIGAITYPSAITGTCTASNVSVIANTVNCNDDSAGKNIRNDRLYGRNVMDASDNVIPTT